MKCKNCESSEVVKNGIVRGKQRYRCKDCGYNFVRGDKRTNKKVAAKKALCILLYLLGKTSFNMLAKLLGSWPSLVYRWIVEAGLNLVETEVEADIKEMEFDEMWHFIQSKKTSFGLSKPLTVASLRTVAWVLGNRDTRTFRRLYEKVKHLKDCVFYTDDWEAFAKVLPADRHVVGKVALYIFK